MTQADSVLSTPPTNTSANNPPEVMTHDDELGMAWWNALSERQRAKWSTIAGNTGRVKDAWEAFKRGSVDQTPPVDPTRRRFLTVAAIGSIAGAGGLAFAAAAPNDVPPAPLAKPVSTSAPDPIYAVIERHRDLAKICDAAWKVRGKCKDFGTLTEEEKAHVRKLNDAVDEAHLPLEAAAENLINTEPTTHAGIIAALFYMRIQHRNDGEHMIEGWLEDEDSEQYIDWRDAWFETLIQAVLQLDEVRS